MKIKSLVIRNFRGISEFDEPVNLSEFNVIIGDNGTSKTTILEAINFCLSPYYLSSRLNINDFHNGTDSNIEIEVELDSTFIAELPDGWNTIEVECNKVCLIAKKREKASPGKAFSDLVTIIHFVKPIIKRGEQGWSLFRKTSASPFKFTERHLSFPNVKVTLPKVFYFPKTRNKQLMKGYNSSFSTIIDELNWRFDKSQRDVQDEEHFKHTRKHLHDTILQATKCDAFNKTLGEVNSILKKLDIPQLDLSLIRTLTPYDQSELLLSLEAFELSTSELGSGIEMAVSIALLEAMAKFTEEDIILIIDEPELHLHPKLQDKLFKHLKEISLTTQIISSTHSPFLFKNVFQESNVSLLMTRKQNSIIQIADAKKNGIGKLKWSPSWGEICYFAYDLPTIEFHDDLYSSLEDNLKQNPTEKLSQNDLESWLTDPRQGEFKEIKWTDINGKSMQETLMTFIRNRIHHPDNIFRPIYTDSQLKESIERMLNLI